MNSLEVNMINKKNIVFIIAVFASFLLLFSINNVQQNLNDIIVEEELADLNPIEDASPMVIFTTVALGAFRGIIADVLWYRSTKMKDDGRYFEMVQLADWITKLQPHSWGGIAFLAWNMSYNVSVTMSSDEDRWRWVQKGIELLRDKALKYNPREPELYRELSRMYSHKISDILDKSHLFYKYQIAKEAIDYLGMQPNWEELYIAEKDLDILNKKYDILTKLLAKNKSFKTLEDIKQFFFSNKTLPEEFKTVFSEMEYNEILNSFRVTWLKEKQKIDIDFVKVIHEKYTIFDWGIPETRAIYWAEMGLKMSRNDRKNVHLHRLINGNLKKSFQSGKIILGDLPSKTMFLPNLSLFDIVRKSYLDAEKELGVDTFKGALQVFDETSLLLFYNYGKYSKAKEIYEDLKTRFPNKKEYKEKFDNYALSGLIEKVKNSNQKQLSASINGFIMQACYFYANGLKEPGVAFFRKAEKIYKIYKKHKKHIWSRVGLPPFEKMKKEVTQACIKNWPKLLSANLKRALEAQ